MDEIALVSNVYQNDRYFDQLIEAEEGKERTVETVKNLKYLRALKQKEEELRTLYADGVKRREVINELQKLKTMPITPAANGEDSDENTGLFGKIRNKFRAMFD